MSAPGITRRALSTTTQRTPHLTESGLRPAVMETRSPVTRLEMMYSPGHNWASFCTRALASSRLCASSTKCRVPSVRILKMENGRRNWNYETNTYGGDMSGQWSDYHTSRGNREGGVRLSW